MRAASGETAFQVVVEQTDLWVVARQDLSEDMAQAMGDFVHSLRGPLKAHIALHPEFAESLTPVPAAPDAPPPPPLIRAMAEAAAICNVGPMAAVAGAIAQAVADAFADQSPDILVENGGDCFMHSTRDRVAALLSDPEAAPHSGPGLGLDLPAKGFPLALCASSATIGHSLSLGQGELVVVKADTGALADAAATALCNLLHTPDDLNRVTDAAASLKRFGLRGVFAQHGGKLAAWGDMELVALE